MRRGGLAAVPVIVFLAILLLPGPTVAEDLEGSRRRLEELEQRIRATAKDLEKTQASTRSLAADIEAVGGEEARIRKRIDTLTRETASLEKRREEKAAQMAEMQEQISHSEVLVRRRLAALYKGGESGGARLLFAASSPARAAEDQDFLRRIVRKDRALLTGYRRQLTELAEVRGEIEALHQQRQAALENLQYDRESLRRVVRLKQDLLARARRDEAELGRQLADLRERAQRLEALVKKLESAKSGAYTPLDGPFGRQKGKLLWPVEGRVRVAFGLSRHPERGTMHESQGIEIAVERELPVVAVWPGRVLFADAFKGFGQLLILDHGDGYYSLYAQAARLTRKVGEQVQRGDVLALSETASGIYFEVRHHGVALDPAAWLSPR